MNPLTTSAFDLPDHLAAKADPALIAGDEQHFAAIAESLEQSIADLSDRLDAARKAPGGIGQEAMDRDLEVHRLTARLRALRRFGLDLCLGPHRRRGRPRARVRRTARPHRQRGSPAAARLALPRGRAVLRGDPRQPDGPGEPPQVPLDPRPDQRLLGRGVHRGRVRRARRALDDQSAFIASLGSSRSARMRDVLGTIQADQDAIIRAGSRGALVVDGGPGTGKTVVALHRTAYLLYSDPRLGHRRGGVLFVGPHQPYLAYVADVLPSLGEEGVQTCTLRDLVPEGAAAATEADPEVAGSEVVRGHGEGDRAGRPVLRGAARRGDDGRDPLVGRLAQRRRLGGGVRGRRIPARRTTRRATRSGRSCVTILTDKHDDERRLARPAPPVARAEHGAASRPSTGRGRCSRRPTSSATCGRCPPTCACALPGSTPTRSGRCSARTPQAWTVSDLPLLDAARQRLGDPGGVTPQAPAGGRRRRRARADGPGRRRPDRGRRRPRCGVMSMLRGEDLQDALVDEAALPGSRPGPARRPVRAHRRRRGPGADRRGVADAAAPLPVPELHHRRGPRPGQARVHRVVAGTARAGRARPGRRSPR